ncbi:MAPEG family protein [Dasania marina]|uniref:MAPEG family protein n=1 Tax=Dasania marina TaxID=471499 RepID=UPI0003810832|nr:MAPEG family protein [Dasania marina]
MLYPMFAMVVLTFIIGFVALKTRFASVKNGEVKASYYRLMAGQEVPNTVTQSTRAFNNQFEVPVLFYVVCTLYISMGIENPYAIYTAWAFVVFRCIHAVIHLTYNHVLHRLSAYWLAILCVLALWLLLIV